LGYHLRTGDAWVRPRSERLRRVEKIILNQFMSQMRKNPLHSHHPFLVVFTVLAQPHPKSEILYSLTH